MDQQDKILGITLGTGLGSAVWQPGKIAEDAALWKENYRDAIFEEYLVTRWFTKRFEELCGIKESGLREIIVHYEAHLAFGQLMYEYNMHLKDFLTYFSNKNFSNQFIIDGNIMIAWEYINKGNIFFSVYNYKSLIF